MAELTPSMGSHSMGSLMKPDDVMERLQMRKRMWNNLDVGRISDLNIHWHDQDNTHRQSGYYAEIDGRDMKLSDQAVKGASRLVKIKDITYWNQFPDKNAFPSTLRHILDNPATNGSRQNSKRLLVRHDGLQVRAVLPFDHQIKDAADLMADFLQMIQDNFGEIQGVSAIEQGDPGDIGSYRVVVGQNLLPELEDHFGQYMMFHLGTSETGAVKTKSVLGLFRTVCTNSAMRERTVSEWNHRQSLNDFYDATGNRLQQLGYYQDSYKKVFGELLNTKLEVPPEDLLHAFKQEKLITAGHFDCAEMYVDKPTEDGRPVETQYDMFNVLTAGARDLPSIVQRQSAETRSMHLFTEPGGIFERLRNAATERARFRAMRNGSDENFD